MTLFGGNPTYDRTRILREASAAESKGRLRKAVSLYRRVLSVESKNGELHARIAPLLARTSQYFDAWKSFQQAGLDLIHINRFDQALNNYRVAVACLPQEIEAWIAKAELEVKLGRAPEALKTLHQGLRRFRARHLRPQAIYLLRRARQIDLWHEKTMLELARLLGKTRQGDEARLLLHALASRSSGRQLRRVRGAQWRQSRSLRDTWLWLRAAVSA